MIAVEFSALDWLRRKRFPFQVPPGAKGPSRLVRLEGESLALPINQPHCLAAFSQAFEVREVPGELTHRMHVKT